MRHQIPRLVALAALGGAALAGACAPPVVTSVSDPAAARRFEIIDVRDSTIRFLLGGTRWVRNGDVGLAVDPQRRDALVARFVVRGRLADTAAAVITGQTARVAPTHVVLLDAPPLRVTRKEAFWLGALSGAVLTTAVALGLR